MSAYSDKVIADGATNYWRLNETSGTSAVDVVGAKNGTISGGVTLNQAGALTDGDKAMTFDGTGQIALPSITTPVGCSVEAWVKSATGSGDDMIWTNRNSGASTNTYLQLASGQPQFGNNSNVVAWSATRIDDGQWHHLVGVSTGTQLDLFVDGVLRSVPNAFASPAKTGTGYIGRDDFAGFATATIDEVALYPTVLSPATIAAHYTLGTTVASGSRPPSFGYWKKVWSAA